MFLKHIFCFLLPGLSQYFHIINGIQQISNEFICIDGSKINLKNVCNGIADCSDNSDETKELCYHLICPKGMFRCHYGACIHQTKKCNKKFECIDKSDESQCGRSVGSCDRNEFRCKSGQCAKINGLCDGKDDCDDGSDESKEICEEFSCPENSFRCKRGGCIHLDSRCNGQQDCIDGSDESQTLCRSLRCSGRECEKLRNKVRCPAIEISRLDITCQSKSGLVPCDNPVPAGTTVKYECKPYFVPVNQKHIHNKHAECQLDGRWNREILKCKPDCGKMNSGPVALIVKGWNTGRKFYPWHVTMYIQEEGKWEFQCGGTLITEKTVLTAGHCTWKLNPENIRLAFAKYETDYSKRLPQTQIIEVKQIIQQSLYQDRNGNYGSDLSVLVLAQPVTLNEFVHPACIDWDLQDVEHHIRENSIGLAVGMGVTEEETFSDVLRAVYLPVVSNEKCVAEQEQDFKKYVTYTVFCAGWRNGTGVCNGDSGGGLLFPQVSDKSRFVLQGVVSISPRRRGTSFCDPDYYTVFTKVAMYVNWLRQVLDTVNQYVQ